MEESRIPHHLRHLPRICAQATCKSTKLKFGYYANKNVNQPRLQCTVCKKYFTLGSSRATSTGNVTDEVRKQTAAENEDVGDQGVGDDAVEATNRALNGTLPSGQTLPPEPQVTRARVDLPHTGNGSSTRGGKCGKDLFEVVRDVIKRHLHDAQNILVHVDLEQDNNSRKLSSIRRGQGEEILQKVKAILQDDLRVQVEVAREEMATRSVAIEEVFQAIGTMRAQADTMDLERVGVYKLHVLRKKAEYIKNYVMEFAPFVSSAN